MVRIIVSFFGPIIGLIFGMAALPVSFAAPDPDLRAFAQAPDFAFPALSTDGEVLSFVQQSGGRQIVVMRRLRDGFERRSLEVLPERERIRWCDWAGPTYVLCGTILPVRSPDRISEKTRLYVIERAGGRVRELNTRLKDPVRDQVIDPSAGAPGQVLFQHDSSGRGYPEVARLDVANGDFRRVLRPHPPVRHWISDGRGTVRLGVAYGKGKASLHLRRGTRDAWSSVIQQSLHDVEAVGPLALGAGNTLYVLRHHRGRAALFHLDLGSGDLGSGTDIGGRPRPLGNSLHGDTPRQDRLGGPVLDGHAPNGESSGGDVSKKDSPGTAGLAATLLFADPLYDVAGPVSLHPATGELLSVRFLREQEQVHYFDAQEAQRGAWLDEQLAGRVNIVLDRSADGTQQLVRSSSDANPPSLYLFDAAKRSLVLIGHEYPTLEDRELAPMQFVVYHARDGQRIPAYLTLPPPALLPVPPALPSASGALPAIVLPHGGPEMRDVKEFDPLVQFLAVQGYAVLQMNYRGSLGYGAAFAAAGVRQWGGLIHDDITDGTRWLVEQGIADPQRICIAGRSFGGYAALLGVTREPALYACAVSYAGVADLMAFEQYTARLQDAELWRERLGSDQQTLWNMSPVAWLDAIEAPVLMIHGRQDPVVPVRQSRRFARMLSDAGQPHRLIERGDCDHDMTIETCRMAVFQALRDFLSTSLAR